MLPLGDPPQLQRKIQDTPNEGHSKQMVYTEKASVTVLVSDGFQDKNGNKEPRWTFYNRKCDSTSTEHNIYAPKLGTPKYIKLTDLKGETDKNAIILGDLNTPLTAMKVPSKQKIQVNKEILALSALQIKYTQL